MLPDLAVLPERPALPDAEDEPEENAAIIETVAETDRADTSDEEVEPIRGRRFSEDDALPGAAAVTLIGHGLWQRAFGGEVQILGSTIQIDGAPTEIIGVMPEGFRFPNTDVDLWLPLTIDPANPARQLYESLGFRHVGASGTSLTFAIELNPR